MFHNKRSRLHGPPALALRWREKWVEVGVVTEAAVFFAGGSSDLWSAAAWRRFTV
jgi:hypothetical protein